MDGTVVRMRLRQGREAQFAQHLHDEAEIIEGMVFEHLHRLDQVDQGERSYYAVVAFESEEACRANAESPDQHAR